LGSGSDSELLEDWSDVSDPLAAVRHLVAAPFSQLEQVQSQAARITISGALTISSGTAHLTTALVNVLGYSMIGANSHLEWDCALSDALQQQITSTLIIGGLSTSEDQLSEHLVTALSSILGSGTDTPSIAVLSANFRPGDENGRRVLMIGGYAAIQDRRRGTTLLQYIVNASSDISSILTSPTLLYTITNEFNLVAAAEGTDLLVPTQITILETTIETNTQFSVSVAVDPDVVDTSEIIRQSVAALSDPVKISSSYPAIVEKPTISIEGHAASAIEIVQLPVNITLLLYRHRCTDALSDCATVIPYGSTFTELCTTSFCQTCPQAGKCDRHCAHCIAPSTPQLQPSYSADLAQLLAMPLHRISSDILMSTPAEMLVSVILHPPSSIESADVMTTSAAYHTFVELLASSASQLFRKKKSWSNLLPPGYVLPVIVDRVPDNTSTGCVGADTNSSECGDAKHKPRGKVKKATVPDTGGIGLLTITFIIEVLVVVAVIATWIFRRRQKARKYDVRRLTAPDRKIDPLDHIVKARNSKWTDGDTAMTGETKLLPDNPYARPKTPQVSGRVGCDIDEQDEPTDIREKEKRMRSQLRTGIEQTAALARRTELEGMKLRVSYEGHRHLTLPCVVHIEILRINENGS
jgi:hypothetical protein